MDAFDEMIRSQIRRAVDQVEPAADLWSRVQHGLAAGPRFQTGLAVAVAAMVFLGAVVAAMGPQALANNLARFVFHLGGVEYTVSNSGATRTPASNGAKGGNDPIPAPVVTVYPALHFTGAPGHFPAAARAALQGAAYHWRVPTWLPAGLPVCVDISEVSKGWNTVNIALGLGDPHNDAIFIRELVPAPKNLDRMMGTDKVAAQEVALGRVQAVQRRTADYVVYDFALDGVAIEVSGSANHTDTVRRIAESLAD